MASNATQSLLDAMGNGLTIVCSTGPHKGVPATYEPRSDKDNRPWLAGLSRYYSRECEAVEPDVAPADEPATEVPTEPAPEVQQEEPVMAPVEEPKETPREAPESPVTAYQVPTGKGTLSALLEARKVPFEAIPEVIAGVTVVRYWIKGMKLNVSDAVRLFLN